jgi:membrane-associated phospholipid phosphatase
MGRAEATAWIGPFAQSNYSKKKAGEKMWNNYLDLAVFHWLGQFTMVSAHFNQVMRYISGSDLAKGFPIMGILWFFWFRDTDPKSNTRRIIIATLVGCLAAIVVARVTNNLGPFQPRPMANAALPHLPYAGLAPPEHQALYIWNSFPSDHAAMFFSLAAGIFLISRALGSLVSVYVMLFIAMPRVYLGLHYMTDILAGGLLGVACVALVTRDSVAALYEPQCMRLLEKYPAAFQTVLFLACMEMSKMFYDVRHLLEGIAKYAH